MASIDDINSTLQGIVRNLSQWNQNLLKVFPRISGTSTLSAGAATVVINTQVSANSQIYFTPTNAAAALLLRTGGLYVSAVTSGASFTLTVQSGVAAGTETFSYIVVTPS
jgi:hypothetical protein